jgi:hypothetical protein
MKEQKKKKYDMNSPEARALMEEITHGTFMKEGTMVAFPTCFPGASIPITADEGRITALDTTPEGIIYGGTSGYRSHVFVAMFHGSTGIVFDLKAVDGASDCVAVSCSKKKVLACLNGWQDGGRILSADLQPLPYDCIQEWGFVRPPFQDLGVVAHGEPIVHALIEPSTDTLIGITSGHLFTADPASSKVAIAGELPGKGRIGRTSTGSLVGLDGDSHLWRYDPRTGSLKRNAFALPAGSWGKAPFLWARDKETGLLYTADGDGRLFSFEEGKGFSRPLGQTMLKPVGPMAVTFDGRVFGFCGPELAKMFCYDPAGGKVTNLGVALSVFERRRYGYVFGDAVTGRDGQIVFGEDDNLGHLWLYFPRIKSTRA